MRRQTYNSSDQSTVGEEGRDYKGGSSSAHSENINLACDNYTGLSLSACPPPSCHLNCIHDYHQHGSHHPYSKYPYEQILSLLIWWKRLASAAQCHSLSRCSTGALHSTYQIVQTYKYICLSPTYPSYTLLPTLHSKYSSPKVAPPIKWSHCLWYFV